MQRHVKTRRGWSVRHAIRGSSQQDNAQHWRQQHSGHVTNSAQAAA